MEAIHWKTEGHKDKENSDDITQRLLLVTGVVTIDVDLSHLSWRGFISFAYCPPPFKMCSLNKVTRLACNEAARIYNLLQ